MHIDSFLHDLAVIMIVAGIVTIIFHRLKQPVVLGYILSGVIIGRHTPPYSLIYDENTVKTLAEIGVIFLMFSLGLEFSIRKLLRVGTASLIAAVSEIILMTLAGYEIGKFFGWSTIDSLFLGAMLSISSTTIIIKALHELGMKKEHFAQMIFGILIIEDILAIGILALLSSIATSGSLSMQDLVTTLGTLLVFLVVSLVIGILIVPRFLSYVAKFKSKEMLLVAVLGLCFGFSLLVIKLGYSVALGAFLIGAIMAESDEIKSISKLISPLTNMFSAIFFVSIGLLVDPHVMYVYLMPIIILTIALVIGKVLVCSLGVFLAGEDGRTSMRVGMGLAQIGEFSFIIAALGISLKVMSPYLYPIIVAVSAITTFLTPYLIKFADPVTAFLAKIMPEGISQVFNTYTTWLQSINTDEEKAIIRSAIKKGLMQIFINLVFVIGIFMTGSYLAHQRTFHYLLNEDLRIENAVVWGISLIISLPFLIAIYRKLKGLSMIIAEIAVNPKESTEYHHKLRTTIAEVIPVAGMLGIVLMIIALSASILPPLDLFIFVIVLAFMLTIVLWSWFIKLHSKLQVTFMDTFKKNKK